MRPKELPSDAQSTEGILTINAMGSVVWANTAAQRLLGWEEADAIGQDLHSLIHFPLDAGLVMECSTCARIMAGTAGREQRDTFVRRDRSVFPVSYSSSVHLHRANRGAMLSFRPVPDRRRVGVDSQVLSAISLALVQATDTMTALTAVLRITCGSIGAELGQAWLPSDRSPGLVCSSAWYSTIEGLDERQLASKGPHFMQGAGSVGRAWNSKEAVWSGDLRADSGVFQNIAAIGVDLKSVLAVPLLVGSEVEAVLQFFYRTKPERHDRVIALMSEIAAHVGPIIHRMKQEETTRENAALYTAAVESAFDAIIVVTEHGVIRAFNGSAERMFGFAAHEVIGQPLALLVPELFVDRNPSSTNPVLQLAESNVASGTIELTAVHRSGNTLPVELSLSESRRNDSSMVTCIVREISHRKRMEKAAQAQSTLLRWKVQFLELARDAILVRDIATDTILFWSEGAEAMYGWFKGEAIGKVAHDLLRTELSQSPEEIEQELLTLDYWEGDIVCAKRNGTQVVISSRWVLQRDEHSQPTAVLEIHSDITERKKIESERAALLRAEREHSNRLVELAALRDDLTAMVVHEISSPLAAIGTLTHLLSTDASLEPDQAHLVSAIRRETDALRCLVADVGDAAKLESEGFAIRVSVISARELLGDAVAFAETLDGHHTVVVRSDAEIRVCADGARIGQVLRNLLSNAAKYSPDGAIIELRSSVNDRHLHIEVVDSGYGIRPSDLNRIFEKFGRGTDAVGRRIPGKGLGLYVSREIVRAHGSELTVESGPAHGTVFGFDLEIVE